MFDGNDSNIPNSFDANGWNVVLSGINYVSGSAGITLHVSDGQGYLDDALILNGTTLVPAGAVFQGDSVPFGASDLNGHLWDIKSYNITSFLSPGPNTLTLKTGTASDCLSLVVAAIDLPPGTIRKLDLAPATASNVVGTPHTVTATLVDGFNNAITSSPVLFKVTGANSATGSDTTSGTGTATFTYTGTNAGTDTITACDDKDASGVCDPGELTKTVTKEWIGGQPCPPGV